MINKVEDYLAQLKKELAGSDRATIQDALSDTEEHLRSALEQSRQAQPNIGEVDALQGIIQKYGAPEEVAAAYKDIETKVSPYLAPANKSRSRSFIARFFGVVADPRAWGALLFLFIAFGTGIAYFTWVVTGISLSAGLLVLIIGIPFAGIFILSVRGLALLEGRLVEALLGERMPRKPLFQKKGMSLWGRFKALLSDKYTWFSMIYMVLQLPLGIAYFTVFITLIAVSLYLIALPILEPIFQLPVFTYAGNVGYFFNGWEIAGGVIVGIILFVATIHLAKFTGKLHGKWAKAVLVTQ